jgi:hypothetical protein
MNWDAIGAIGEVLGAIAVVMTLLYLAVQVKNAKNATTDATRHTRVSGIQNILIAMATDDALRSSVNKTQVVDSYFSELATKFGISVDEAQRVDIYASYWFWTHWGQYASSTTAEDMRELKNLVNTFYRSPFMLACWELSPIAKPILDPKFVTFVDSVLAEESNLE